MVQVLRSYLVLYAVVRKVVGPGKQEGEAGVLRETEQSRGGERVPEEELSGGSIA